MNGLRALWLAGVMVCGLSVPAQAMVEETYNPEEPFVVTPWYGAVDAESRMADMGFIVGMRPHHAGALSMSQDYLNDPDARNGMMKQLARGILHNQTFEIGMLDRVEQHLGAAEGKDVRYGQVATLDLAQKERFFRAPIPGPLDALGADHTVSRRDVEFAKAMIVHHEGALVMCRDYLSQPAARNGYLKAMCIDILKDQALEIAFMKKTMAGYDGDLDSVRIDPAMVHGMEGMNHDMSAMAHGAYMAGTDGHDGHKAHNDHNDHKDQDGYHH